MTDRDEAWGERYRRPYVATGGRTRPTRAELALETLVSTTRLGTAQPQHDRLRRAALELCTEVRSIAELGAYLGVPVGVARILADDLTGEGLLRVHAPAGTGERPGLPTLQRVLAGLRAL